MFSDTSISTKNLGALLCCKMYPVPVLESSAQNWVNPNIQQDGLPMKVKTFFFFACVLSLSLGKNNIVSFGH